MNGFEGLLSSNYGFKPQGKSAPMAAQKPNNSSANYEIPFNFEIGVSKKTAPSSNLPVFDDRKSSANDFTNLGVFNVGFPGGRTKSTGVSNSSSVNLDKVFGGRGDDSGPSHGFSSLPVYDRPVYDDEDLSSAQYEDIFSSSSAWARKVDAFDGLLGGFARKENTGSGSMGAEKVSSGFDDLLPRFVGGGSAAASTKRNTSDAAEKPSHVTNDPFVVLESTSTTAPSSSAIFNDPFEEIGILNNSDKRKVESASSGGVFDDMDHHDSSGKSAPAFSADRNGRQKDESPLQTRTGTFERQTPENGDVSQRSSVRSPKRVSLKKMDVDDYRESPQSVFEMPSASAGSQRAVRNASPPAHRSSGYRESNPNGNTLSDKNFGASDDIWLTVSEVPLFTQPTAAPPPSRPPPPRPAHFSKTECRSLPVSDAQKKGSEYSSFSGSVPHFHSRKSEPAGVRGPFPSPVDDLEGFAMGRNRSDVDGSSDVPGGEDFETNSVAAAAMKEAMAKAEAKFRQVRGAKEKENARTSRSREAAQAEKEELISQDSQERKFNEHQERLEQEQRQREKDEEERRQREEEEKRRIDREREEKESEKRRIEKERELVRQAVDRAAREARERAAAEARARAERAAVQKAQAEARERAERAAVQRAHAEARERAAAEAKERAEKAAVEARERARAEAREKEARERAAAAARANQQKNENDLESFFTTGSRASSAPRPRANSSDMHTNFQSKPAAEATRTSVNSSSNMRKASSSTNIVDDLSSIFGGPPSSGEFQEVVGESEERRRARLERHQRTQERAAKALAEKNARDVEAQREQAERHRIAEILDVEIKRWAAGKEGNLRALLSTLQYVLWPECGWQPVSLTDLITAVAVKKVYRKATLCIHPDKVQQKGATLQQKYIAEKVFDLLKEAWNKFNSEELF